MQTVSLFDAKTHLSRIVEDLLSGKEDRVVIARRGKPVVLVTPAKGVETSRRVGLAKGRFDIPDDIDGPNPTVAALFEGGGVQ
ncbi:MAG: type II toxin-antitoxin system Phd/YefM family antitoxin [Candidatus Marinimicrobia bacterium]|nr:type II toxin-antitoxin system Phd/YefM family antitoxin [Candidatus Neomarinimicrobiota bacterium]